MTSLFTEDSFVSFPLSNNERDVIERILISTYYVCFSYIFHRIIDFLNKFKEQAQTAKNEVLCFRMTCLLFHSPSLRAFQMTPKLPMAGSLLVHFKFIHPTLTLFPYALQDCNLS